MSVTTDTTTNTYKTGDKVIVTRWYNADSPNEVPVIATVVAANGPDGEGDILVRDIERNVDRFAYRGCYQRVPQAGERIKAVKVPGLSEFDGQVGIVANPAGQPWAERSVQAGNVENGTAKLFVTFDSYTGGPLYVTEWEPVGDEPVEAQVDNPFVIAALGGVGSLSDSAREVLARCTTGEQLAVEYARVADTLARRVSATERLHQEIAALRNDLTIGGKELAEQAEQRDWCEEYDQIVHDTANNMSAYGRFYFEEAATRTKEYEVEVEVPVMAKARKTITVTASSEDEATEKAQEQAQEEMDDDDIDHYTLEWAWEDMETEVQ